MWNWQSNDIESTHAIESANIVWYISIDLNGDLILKQRECKKKEKQK